ncbi:DMT family transporter [Parasphingopyxis marina]|uniref:DMT family transporter n=1 Tax=Parasphingopyxis marina TaxID=2761622 RepID=A0A842HZU2_9SPHN|nr:DMT family transporter [Parasphingopyxis marina]MBC2778492.1 DMT family transporter [Parasphingopyxis marina]
MNGRSQDGSATRAQLFAGMAVFGSATPVSKIVTAAMPVFLASLLRVAIGALALAPFAWKQRGTIGSISRKDWAIIGLIALFGMAGFSAFMLYGMRMVSGVAGAIVMSTTPAVTAAASMLLMGDHPTWRKIAAIALAVAGVLVLQLGSAGGSDGPAPVAGILLIFAAVCCEACYTLLGKKASEEIDPVLVAFLAAALSLPFFLPFAIWQLQGFDWGGVDRRAWLALLWYGAGTLALGSWLWYRSIARVEGTIAAAFMGVMPVSALVLSYILLSESFEWIHLLGFATVFAGVVLISWEHARMAKD